MTAINIIKNTKYNDLFYQVQKTEINELFSKYNEEENFLFEESFLIPTRLDIDINLITSQLDSDVKGDSKSGIIIYEALKNLTPIAASNKCLWATLTHREFKKYTIKRWPLKNKEQDRGLINSHFFFDKDDRRAFRRNAISRLWWGTFLTVSPWEKDTKLLFLQSNDKYKFTKIMLGSQQLWFDVQERRWGCDVVYRTCFLEAYYRLIMSKMHEKCSLSPTDFSNELAKLFTASLVHDVGLVLRSEPEKIIENIFELSKILLNRSKTN